MTRADVPEAIDRQFESFRADLRNCFTGLRLDMDRHKAILIRWMFFFWLATVIPLAVLFIAVLRR